MALTVKLPEKVPVAVAFWKALEVEAPMLVAFETVPELDSYKTIRSPAHHVRRGYLQRERQHSPRRLWGGQSV